MELMTCGELPLFAMDITFPAIDWRPTLFGMLMVELDMLDGKLPSDIGSTTPMGLLTLMFVGDCKFGLLLPN